MARDLKNQTNIEAPSADYPDGRIKNDSGANDGVPVDEKVYGDIHQFMMKLLREADITANDLPDNTTNTFQLYEAINQLAVAPLLAHHGIFNERLTSEEPIGVSAIQSVFVTTDNRLAFTEGSGGSALGDLRDITNGATTPIFTFGAGILTDPTDLFIDTVADRIYVTDTTNNLVNVFNLSTGANIPGEEFGGGVLSFPKGIFIDSGKAYIPDTNIVRVFNVATGANIPAEEFGSGTLSDPRRIFILSGKAYVADNNNSEVYVFDVATQTFIPGETLGTGVLSQPDGVSIIGNKVYVADENLVAVKVFDLRTQTYLFTEDFTGVPLTDPRAVFIRNNKAYVADFSNMRIHVYKQNHLFEFV